LILAIDPGKATGLAYLTAGAVHASKTLPYHEALEYAVWEIDGARDTGLTVVCEDFIISSRTVRAGTSGWRRGLELEFIGVVRWYCWKEEVEFVLQAPADAKSFGTNSKLKQLGWWQGGAGHADDASRHLLLAAVRKGIVDPAELVVSDR